MTRADALIFVVLVMGMQLASSALIPLDPSAPTLADKYWSLGVADQLGVAQAELLSFDSGSVPAWLNGTFILGGPSQFKMGSRTVNHLFDGFARISTFRFGLSESQMLFSSRLMDSSWYNNSARKGDITAQFLMNATSPPRIADRLPMLNALAPNDNNIVFPLRMNKSTYWYLSDSETRIQFDANTLRVQRELRSSQPGKKSDYSGDAEPEGYMCTIGTAHALFDGAGDLISQMGCSPSNPFAGKKDQVVVYRIKRSDPSCRLRIASFTPQSGHAAYMHSFGLSENFAVFVEQAVGFDMSKMMEGKNMIDGMPVDYSVPTYFHIVPLNGSKPIVQRAPFSFTFNHVANMVEDKGHLILDIFEVFRSGHPFRGGSFDIWLQKSRRDSEIQFEALRFNISLDSSHAPTVRGITGRDVSTPCVNATCDLVRLPRINPRFASKHYCHIYGMQTKYKGGPFASQAVVRVDVCKQTIQPVGNHFEGQFPHELVFVPNPNGTAEDDGVLIGHVLDGPNNRSFVQVVDGRTLQRIATIGLPLRLGEMIHGNWFGESD